MQQLDLIEAHFDDIYTRNLLKPILLRPLEIELLSKVNFAIKLINNHTRQCYVHSLIAVDKNDIPRTTGRNVYPEMSLSVGRR